ncbi:MAG: hypothetical protein PHP59_00820 [Methanofollis sp.]|uniref:hypothetical protein n=1 Tax=Methanofollis sp. TaxID=2052835 RepID=UPI00263619F9|nr:hypothetical protein [Methanofollis sp.]MDD4253903.1 hypothetical protein [Methanofollis sp.]
MNRRTENIIALLFGVLLLAVVLAVPPGGENGEGTPVPTPAQTTLPSPTTPAAGEIFRYTSEDFENRTFTVPVDLTTPPMEIEYTVQPRLVARTGDPSRLSPSPDSWFVVRVFDGEGDLVAENGYGLPAGEKGSFAQNEKGGMKIYAAGRYTVDVRFNEMIVDVVATLGR